MANHILDLDERRQKRVSSKHPVDYEIGGTILKGIIVNASSNGIMVKSSVSLATVLDVLSFLDREPGYRTVLEFIFEGEPYVAEAEIKHFHLDSSGGGRYTFDLTDCDLNSLEVGMPVEMSFRRKYRDTLRGVHGYFWKATPPRMSTMRNISTCCPPLLPRQPSLLRTPTSTSRPSSWP